MPGAKDVGVEFFTLSKSYNMPGWRIGFAVGNREIIAALARIKSYLDYGIFQPVQIAATHALNGPQHYVDEIRETYRKRRDVLCEGLDARRLARAEAEGDDVRLGRDPRRSTSRWARSSSRSSCCARRRWRCRPGIGFGEYGDHYVRFALIENEHRTRQAIRGIRKALGATPRPGARAGRRPG